MAPLLPPRTMRESGVPNAWDCCTCLRYLSSSTDRTTAFHAKRYCFSSKQESRRAYFFFLFLLIFSFAVCVLLRALGNPSWGVKVIRAVTDTFPFSLSRLLAVLVRLSGTVIVGGPPEAVEGFRGRLRFLIFVAETLSGAAASLTETLPLD